MLAGGLRVRRCTLAFTPTWGSSALYLPLEGARLVEGRAVLAADAIAAGSASYCSAVAVVACSRDAPPLVSMHGCFGHCVASSVSTS